MTLLEQHKKVQEFIERGERIAIDEFHASSRGLSIPHISGQLFEASKTDEYKSANKKVRYGLWQIMQELNIKIDSGRKDKKGNPVMVYKYTALNTEIKKLDDALKNYYANDIIPMLFKYELIK